MEQSVLGSEDRPAPAPWCEEPDQLHSIYSFPHLRAAERQEEEHVGASCRLFTKFVRQLPLASGSAQPPAARAAAAAAAAASWPGFTPADRASLTVATDYLQSGLVTWFPKFGCALLAWDDRASTCQASGEEVDAADLQAGLGPQPGHLSIYVLALDGWRFEAHSSPGGCIQHTARIAAHGGEPCEPTLMHCGPRIPPGELPKLISTVHAILKASHTARTNQDEKGFQRTPAFILAAVKDAVEHLADERARGGGGGGGGGSCGASQKERESKQTLARGGTTDVGLHTGHDTVRDTSWPLVRAAVQVVLVRMGVCGPQQHPDLLLRRAMAHMDLWLLRRQVRRLAGSPAAATPAALTAAMHMLCATAAKAANLAAEGEDVSAFESACAAAREKLERMAAERAWQAAEQHCVPDAASPAALGLRVLPAGVLPGLQRAQQSDTGMEAAKQRCGMNLGSVPLLEPGASFADMQQLLQGWAWSNPATNAVAQLVLRSVERELLTRVTALGGSGSIGSAASARPELSDAEMAALEAVVDKYRAALHAFLQTPAAQSAMRSELCSREVLVVWCAYCLAHDSLAQRHPLVREYWPALQFADLRHLVLSDRQTVDALMAVAAYLNQQQQPLQPLIQQQQAQQPDPQGGAQLLFSLRDGGSGTFDFAERFAERDSRLQQVLDSERADAAARVSAHWAVVQQQKKDLEKLRKQLAMLQERTRKLQEEWAKVSRPADDAEYAERHRLDGIIKKTWKDQNRCNNRIAALLRPPDKVLQPLPSADGAARRWLFFLHMPPAFRCLSRLSFLAQQVLLPRPLDASVERAVAAQPPAVLHSLVRLFNEHRGCRTYLKEPEADGGQPPQAQTGNGADGALKLITPDAPPAVVDGASLDTYQTQSDGVWYPDLVTPSMVWAGNGSTADSGCGFPTYFNPFAPVDAAVIEEYFTERLPGSAAALQWAAHQHGTVESTPLDRGNRALANQDASPTKLLSKSEFLQFGRMRAYPLQQLWNLCEVLRRQDQALPLTEPVVQLLLRQLLFHVGPISISTGGSSTSTTSSPQPQLLWRTGWEQPGDVLDALCAELGALADTLDGRVRDHDAILLLGEMAAYLADWHAPCGAVARRFAAITMREADQLQAELDAAAGVAGDDRRVSELLARQVRWRVMALLCYGAGPLAPGVGPGQQQQQEDAAVMVRLMVQICHGLTFQDDPAKLKELQLLRARAHNVMASRVQRLRELISGREDAVLTAAVASVLERTPASLPWCKLVFPKMPQQPESASYQAEGSDRRLYSINILDGTVLFDGCPPSRLPKEVTQHPLYLRTFGDFNFEVAFAGGATTAAGLGGSGETVLQTLRKVRGRLYDFRLCAAAAGQQQAQLVITEEDVENGGERLELLDTGPDSSCRGWGEELPVRLRELHSHWLNRQRGVLVLRPRSFQEHDCVFLAKCLPAGGQGHTLTLPVRTDTLCEYDCRRVPLHLQSRHWRQLEPVVLSERQAAAGAAAAQSALDDRLVLLRGSQILERTLAKFEDPSFIHTFCSVSSGEVSFELPRCDLEFSMQQQVAQAQQDPGEQLQQQPAPDGPGLGRQPGGGHEVSYCQLLSRNYTGYRLRRVQQLAERCRAGGGGGVGTATYTLPEFRQYLVLERVPQAAGAHVGAQRAEVVVLMPAGAVASSMWGVTHASSEDGGSGGGGGAQPLVSITMPVGAGRFTVHCYEVHGRFGHLRAPTRLARLQLAALYAATSTLLPEPGSRCTGAQMAMELLRQCWSMRPLDAAEAEQLAAVGRLGGHLAPGLHLLAHDLAASAAQLAHLHAAAPAGGAAALAAPSAPADPACAPDSTDGDASAAVGSGTDCSSASLDERDAPEAPQPGCDHVHAFEELFRRARDELPLGWGVNPRLLLTPTEEVRVLGTRMLCAPAAPWRRQRQWQAIPELQAAPAMPATYVWDAEAELRDLLLAPPGGTGAAVQPYPLAASDAPLRPLEADMHSELRESWEAHHSQPDAAAYGVKPDCLERVRGLKVPTTARRRELEVHLLRQLELVPVTVGCHGTSLRLLRAAAAAAEAGPLDLMRLAVRPLLVCEFNPFLSPEAVQELQRRVLTWLQLCVLEDRLGRLEALAAAHGAGDDCLPQLVQELSVHRTWDAAAHPEWLVFEVESQLQIRPQQYTVARMLMEGGDGPIAQLTMGEGKTRVILPMLVLALADGKRVVSLTFLSTLLDEAYAYLHGALCAGVLGRKLFTMPFHRDIELRPARVLRMRAALVHCKQEHGALLVTPEHRLSLDLKWKEIGVQLRAAAAPVPPEAARGQSGRKQAARGGQVAAQLTALLRTPVLSILDESDELLHHRFQLIYACGGKTSLQSFGPRTGAIRAVLASVTFWSLGGDRLQLPHGARVLEPPPVTATQEAAGAGPGGAAAAAAPAVVDAVAAGAFCGLRLLPGPDLEAALPAFHRQLARDVLLSLPFEFQHWNALVSEEEEERVVACVTDTSTSAEEALGEALVAKLRGPGGGSELYEFVLALRGLLGCGILKHGLSLRNQVDYGIDRRKAGTASSATRARTRMAVPYRAAHTPSERSEFAQPDVALLLTHLAYYYDGLTLLEFTAAVERLQHGLGKEAAADYYREWLELSTDSIPDEELARFADVNQLDASSSSQMAAMHRHLRRNTAVVDFWLRFCVLPAETRQYPQRLGASAWDLAAAGDRVMGFSGTNDNYRLLPLRVHQAPPDDAALKATNGRMLDVIIQHSRGFHTLPSAEAAGGVPVWQSLLQTALNNGAHAVLDCGALLAGTSNRHAAKFLLAEPRLQQLGFRGVTYYDEQERGWVVLEPTGRCLPRASSPLQEHETFVLYDEARCRGADLKLQRSAVGMLTLGPRVCKDKLMQAAGRLRQLGRGQALRFAATADIAAHVLGYAAAANAGSEAAVAASGPRATDVLAWVMGNTVDANLHGVAQWAAQGLHFATTLGAPERSVQPEVLGLQELYAGSKAPHPVGEVVAAAAQQARLRCGPAGAGANPAGGGAAGGAASGSSAGDGPAAAAATGAMDKLEQLAARYGDGHSVRAGSGADEECERELELEEEEEQEQERQALKQKPAAEEDWPSYAGACTAASIKQLQAEAPGMVRPLRSAVSRLDSKSTAHTIEAMPWSRNVYVSRNYLHSVDAGSDQPLNEYLRPVGWLLVLAREEVVLLSEREADQLLAAAWRAPTGTAAGGKSAVGGVGSGGAAAATALPEDGPLLVSLAYAWQAVTLPPPRGAKPPLLVMNLGQAAAGGTQHADITWAQLRQRLGVRQLVSVRVFAGETSYRVRPGIADDAVSAVEADWLKAAAASVEAELRRLVQGRRPQVQQLLVMRGRQSHMARSDLEKAVEGLPLQL
ncbi:hypothetical protein HXX76_003244 [Chlamydomonas incerta]|uniref:ubiquitinyl hydrolase 1 n=1 Tax=Chlamydomonas incerta TaxID=51695 RepID=A0A835TA38_CHLIN|nr:hypothetical protein HXX76_003244 [Chlamydomonas incerta]|eukprot:KAG2441624.1 hypothetical protein HXX76_003244 [Chlamydomonas incerta]